MKVLKHLTLLACLFVCTAASAVSPSWTTNYEQALQDAKSENKPIVLFFTGSDWCKWCKQLEKEAFNTQEFINAAGNRFIFVELDFPMSSSLDSKTAAQNDRLQRQFGINGYPTVIVLDSQGRKIGQTGYKPGGGASYANHLKNIANIR